MSTPWPAPTSRRTISGRRSGPFDDFRRMFLSARKFCPGSFYGGTAFFQPLLFSLPMRIQKKAGLCKPACHFWSGREDSTSDNLHPMQVR